MGFSLRRYISLAPASSPQAEQITFSSSPSSHHLPIISHYTYFTYFSTPKVHNSIGNLGQITFQSVTLLWVNKWYGVELLKPSPFLLPFPPTPLSRYQLHFSPPGFSTLRRPSCFLSLRLRGWCYHRSTSLRQSPSFRTIVVGT